MVKAEINAQHNHPSEDITMPYQEMKRELSQILDSEYGWSHSSTKLYRVLMKRLEAKNEMVMFKSRPSSVKRLVRVIKKRHFMSLM